MAATRNPSEHGAPPQEITASGRPAVHGQDVVDQRVDFRGEQAEIKQRAAEQNVTAASERAGTPSVRFWDSPSARAGALFALVAGLLTLATRIWPVAPPQSHGAPGMLWVLPSMAVGFAYLGGFFLADRYWKSARVLLIVAAVAHMLIGLMSGTAVDAQAEGAGVGAMLFDLAPAVLAIIAAILIAPPSHAPAPTAHGESATGF